MPPEIVSMILHELEPRDAAAFSQASFIAEHCYYASESQFKNIDVRNFMSSVPCCGKRTGLELSVLEHLDERHSPSPSSTRTHSLFTSSFTSHFNTRCNNKNRRENKMAPKQRVAIVGSGMAGLVTAYLLANDAKGRFEVVVLEMQEKLSLDSASYTLPKLREKALALALVEVEAEEDDPATEEERRVDLPMRAFAAGYYDNLRKMYTYLGVRFEEPRFVYSLASASSSSSSSSSTSPAKGKKAGNGEEKKAGGNRDRDRDGVYFIHSSNNHILPPIRPPGVGFGTWVVEIVYLLFWYVVFTAGCFFIAPRGETSSSSTSSTPPTSDKTITTTTNDKTLLSAKNATPTPGETLREYLTRLRIPTYYTTHYFLPLMASATTCTHDELLEFPAIDIATYARRTFRKPHYTVKGGVRQAERKLSGGVGVRFNTRVRGVERISENGKVKVSWVSTDGDGDGSEEGEEEFDKVIIAVTPDVVGKIFPPLREKMSSIPTTSVASIVHTDYTRVGACSAHLRTHPRFQRRSTTNPTSGAGAGVGVGVGVGGISAAIHMVTDFSSPGSKTKTESIHEHPSSMLITTYPLDESGIEEGKVLHRAGFTRVLRSVRSRGVVNSIFAPRGQGEGGGDGDKEGEGEDGWRNGDGGVYVVGGWCWDGMVMLEGCIVSAIRVADALGVDVPWR
ncbi:hypothetical protein BJX70DRAFT_388216 [Aspergillus crustosus]